MRARGLGDAQHVSPRDAIAAAHHDRRRLFAGGAAAIRRGALWAALLGAPGMIVLFPPAAARAQDAPAAEAPAENPYVQRGVPAEATAENAVQARERAYASAQRLAYGRMAAQLGLPANASDSQIDRLVSSIVVEQERASRAGFSGRVTVNFNPSRVGRGSGGGAGAAVASGGTGGSVAAAAPAPAPLPASVFVEAAAVYRSLPEWLDLRRRLQSHPQVARVDVDSISVDRARIRLSLRAPAEQAMAEMAGAGLRSDLGPDGAWRVGLGGG